MSDENRIIERKRIEEPKDSIKEMSETKNKHQERNTMAKAIAYSGQGNTM